MQEVTPEIVRIRAPAQAGRGFAAEQEVLHAAPALLNGRVGTNTASGQKGNSDRTARAVADAM